MLRVTGVTSHNSRVHSAVRPSEPHREKGGRVKNGLEVKRSMKQREEKHEYRRERQRNRKCPKVRWSRESSNCCVPKVKITIAPLLKGMYTFVFPCLFERSSSRNKGRSLTSS